nr:MAK10-like protein [Tanacetum cinerariifolium]
MRILSALLETSKPSHEGYRNTIELPVGNNMVPLRSDTIWLVQNRCSFHELRSKEPNQHLKDFLKLVDLLDFNGENRERTRMRPNPQPETLGTTFEARLRDYMAAHTERMKRFKNAFSNSARRSMRRGRKKDIYDVATGDDSKEIDEPDMEVLVKEAETKNGAKSGDKNKPIKKTKKEEVVELHSLSRPPLLTPPYLVRQFLYYHRRLLRQFFGGPAGYKFLKKPEHLSHPTIDLLALFEKAFSNLFIRSVCAAM